MAYNTLTAVKSALYQLAQDNEFSQAGRSKINTLANDIEVSGVTVDTSGIASAVRLALANDFSGLAKKTDLATLAKSTELSSVAKSSELVALAKTSDLSGLATSNDLQPLAKSAELLSADDLSLALAPLARSSELEPLAKSSELPDDYMTPDDIPDDYARSSELPRDYAKASKLQDLQTLVTNVKGTIEAIDRKADSNNFSKADGDSLKNWLNTTRENALDTAYAKAFVYVESRIAALYDALTTASSRLIAEFAAQGALVGQYATLVDQISPKVDLLRSALETLDTSVVTANNLTTFVTDVLAISQLIDKMNAAWNTIAQETSANRQQVNAILSSLTAERDQVIHLVEDLCKYAKTTNVIDSGSNALDSIVNSLRLAKEYDEKKRKEAEDSVF